MKANMGTADRTIRIVVGLAIGVLGIVFHSWWGLVGLLPIATGMISYCGLYSVLGINTCGAKSSASGSK